MNYTFQFGPVFQAWPLLLHGTWMTIQLSGLAMLFGLAVAVLCAWGKTSGPAPLRALIQVYIELIRNTPFPPWLLVVARAGRERGLSLASLATVLRADPLQLEPVVDLLEGIDWRAPIRTQRPELAG